MGIQSFVSEVNHHNNFNPESNVYESIWGQYEHVVFESLITSFGLDFLVGDLYGGDVDTVNNVRMMDSDKELFYKNVQNEKAYNEREKYNPLEYHQDVRYKEINAKVSERKKEGKLFDAYTGKKMARNAKSDLDHIVAANEIHEDPGRILAGLNGVELANCEENLKATDRSINRSKKDKNLNEYLKKIDDEKEFRQNRIETLKSKDILNRKEQNELHKLEKQDEVNPELVRKQNEDARKSYNEKISNTYYTSKRFATDASKAACKRGVQMGSRQVIGFVFAEIWFATKLELQQVPAGCEFKDTIDAIIVGIRKGVENAKQNYKELINRFFVGAEAGIMASLTTTLCNIFFTTSKNLGRCIRSMYASITQAGNVIFFNPDELLMGDRIKMATVIMATGATVLVGTSVGEMISKTPIGVMPVIGEIVQVFASTLISGLFSCSLLIMLDRSRFMNNIVDYLNHLPDVVDGYKEIANIFETLAADIEKYDIDKFEEEVNAYRNISIKIIETNDENELNDILMEVHKTMAIKIPWEGDFNGFMGNKECKLVFE